jgi:hypothetical protein
MDQTNAILPRDRAAQLGAQAARWRQITFFGSLLYTFIYIQIYAVMGEYWDYLGFTLMGYDAGWHYAAYPFVAVASMAVTTNRRTVGEFIVNVLYIILFVPCIITPFLQGMLPFGIQLISAALLTVSVLFVSWCVSRGASRDAVLPARRLVEPEIFWTGLIGLWLVMNIYVVAVFGTSLRLAGLTDVYEQRFLADSVVGGGLVYYAILNLAGGLNPLLLALGLRRRSLVLIGLAVSSQLLMYSTSALKSIIASTVLMVVLHFALGRKEGPRTNLLLAGVLGVMIVGLLLLPFYNGYGTALDTAMTLVFNRTIMTPGVIYGVYVDFFSVYPTTHFSHISVVRAFVNYPYGMLQMGQVIGQYLSNSVGLEVINANANYLATDGIGSYWLPGIAIVGFISGAVFWMINRLLARTDASLSCVTLLPGLMYLSNVSLFTWALTYGGAMAIILLWLLPRAGVAANSGSLPAEPGTG